MVRNSGVEQTRRHIRQSNCVGRQELACVEADPSPGMVSSLRKSANETLVKVLIVLTTTSSIPASIHEAICSDRAFAVIPMIGTCRMISSVCSSSRMRRAHVSPSMIGISTSSRMIDKGICSMPVDLWKVVVDKSSRASRPWSAT